VDRTRASRPGTWAWLCDPGYWLTVLRAWSWRRRDKRWSTARGVAEPLARLAALIEAGITVPADAAAQGPGAVRAASGSSDPGDPLSPEEILASARRTRRDADAALARRNRMALTEPSRPTWIGSRFQDLEERIARAHHLDIAVAWPRLWPLLSGNLRADLQAAYGAYTAAARLVGWALLYSVIGAWWWPAAVIAVVAVAAGWRQGRAGAAALADLIETAVDLQGRTLATGLGLRCEGPFDKDTGYQVTRLLRKDPG
jgi:hypothetical protein